MIDISWFSTGRGGSLVVKDEEFNHPYHTKRKRASSRISSSLAAVRRRERDETIRRGSTSLFLLSFSILESLSPSSLTPRFPLTKKKKEKKQLHFVPKRTNGVLVLLLFSTRAGTCPRKINHSLRLLPLTAAFFFLWHTERPDKRLKNFPRKMMMKTKSNPRHMMAWLGNSQVTKSGLSERRKEGGRCKVIINDDSEKQQDQ